MQKYDEIRIEELKIFAHHGVYDFETENGQDFYVDAVLYTDTKKAGKTDELTDSTNYGEVCAFITDFLTSHTYKLLEAAAENVVEAILLHFPLIKGVSFELRKPQAPIPLPFGCVSFKIERFWHTAYIALGSNMGEKEKYLDMAIEEFRKNPKIHLGKVASYIETEPYGGVEQERFINTVCQVETLYFPYDLLDELHRIEQLAKRKREIHWGPRTLDLDIIYYDDLIMAEENLIIPHIDMENRTFVLEPLCEIAPYLRHPVTEMTTKQMIEQIR